MKMRLTVGNFRLVDRLTTRIERIERLNRISTPTPELVDAAREALLIGH